MAPTLALNPRTPCSTHSAHWRAMPSGVPAATSITASTCRRPLPPIRLHTGTSSALPSRIVQRQVDPGLRARVAGEVDVEQELLAVERILAEQLGTEIQVDGALHFLHRLAEEADVGARLADAGDAVCRCRSRRSRTAATASADAA